MTLARETGWSEDQILKLPMATALTYLHACLWANGAWTVRRADVNKKQHDIGELLAALKTMPEEEEDDE